MEHWRERERESAPIHPLNKLTILIFPAPEANELFEANRRICQLFWPKKGLFV
jgi:hypothetical protein